MNSEFSKQTLAVYKNALIQGIANHPLLNTVWYVPQADSYLSLEFLVNNGITHYKAGKAHPSILLYALESGDNAQKEFVRSEFFRDYFSGSIENFYDGWFCFIPYFVDVEPTLKALIQYKKGSLVENDPDLEIYEDWLRVKNPLVYADLQSFVRPKLPVIQTDAVAFESICDFLFPLGIAISDVLSSDEILNLSSACFQTWHDVRLQALKDEINPAFISSRRLKWCWRFGWNEALQELCNNPVFIHDCLYPNEFAQSRYSVATDVAENILTLSLGPCKGVLSAFSTGKDQLHTHVSLAIKLLGESFPESEAELRVKLPHLIFEASFPPELPSLEAKRFWCAQHGIVANDALVISIHTSCWEIWRLRLALAIVASRIE
jgi:hypothetical protein